MDNCNSRQVGGNHYKNDSLPDHWDVVYQLKWCYLVGAATKYLWRLGRKGDESKKIEDIEKAIHYLQKKVEQLRDEQESRLGLVRYKEARVVALQEDDGDATSAYVNQ